MNELTKLINTLKKDNTNPLINKDVIIKAFEAARGELDDKANKYTFEDLETLTSDEIASLKCGDVVIQDYEGELIQYIVLYESLNSKTLGTLDADGEYIYLIHYQYATDTWAYDSSQDIPIPPDVVANPTLAGTEDALIGLQVGDTKYKVADGTKLYKHVVIKDGSGDGIVIYNNSSTLITFDTLLNALKTAISVMYYNFGAPISSIIEWHAESSNIKMSFYKYIGSVSLQVLTFSEVHSDTVTPL